METEVVIIGGGVVGLGIFKALADGNRGPILLERHDAPGRETSSRNSGVIHGGMYYQPGSLKARLCVEGRRLLYPLLAAAGVRHLKCGKTIVAVSPEDEENLAEIYRKGIANGVEGLRKLARDGIARHAPGVKAAAALHSPETGVVDVHGFMDALLKMGEAAGGTAVFGGNVIDLEAGPGPGWRVVYRDSEGLGELTCRAVVNAAGLEAQAVMRLAGLRPEEMGLGLKPCAGRYFSVGGDSRKRISGLVYPAPEKNLAGLGIHTLVDFGGGVKLGPDTQYLAPADAYDYSVDPELREKFYLAASRYLPFLRREDLAPDMAGVRPKLSGPGEKERDFHIRDETSSGAAGFINLAGIESPGLTGALAIGSLVGDMLKTILE